MGWNVLVELALEHDYYAPSMPPVAVRPAAPDAFARAGLMLRQSGAQVFVLAEDGNYDLPAQARLDLVPQNLDVIAVTEGLDWAHYPQIELGVEGDRVAFDAAEAMPVAQAPGKLLFARVAVTLNHSAKRRVTLSFAARASHWAYHVIGPGNADVVIEDPDGTVEFETLGEVSLPDGKPARVIRTRAALPLRARPRQRFCLMRPGPFGPRTLIPVLPAPAPKFATVPGPDGAGAIIQSDIYVSIF